MTDLSYHNCGGRVHFAPVLLGILAGWCNTTQAATVPPGFLLELLAGGHSQPVQVAFLAPDKYLVAQKNGLVTLYNDGTPQVAPFIDLIDEVGDAWDRGMLGMAVDPDVDSNGFVYFLYTVDPVFGQPDESFDVRTFSRLTRYTVDPATNGNTALLTSRLVLIGENSSEGFPSCGRSHSVGSIRFGHDGSLFAGSGDAANFLFMDDGGTDATCFEPDVFPGFPIEQDVGAFRSQDLDTLAGKIIRINPATGEGYSDNPFYTGDSTDIRSKVWVSGLRNPFRFVVRPDSPSPGTLYIGDVGWNFFEEINVAHGGENFGWPCFEGIDAQPEYSTTGMPAHSDCSSIGLPSNPGAETKPLVSLHHGNASLSSPAGFTSRCIAEGAFYAKSNYPEAYRGVGFLTDCVFGWVHTVSVDNSDSLIGIQNFATGFAGPVAVETDPFNGDMIIVEYGPGSVWRVRYPDGDKTDFDNDGDTDLADFNAFQQCLTGPSMPALPACQFADTDTDGDVDLSDFVDIAANLALSL